jgi:hypothetical protein
MKRFLIGCLSVVVLLGLAGGFLAYRFVYQPAQGLIKSAEKFGQITELEQQIQNVQAFTIPTDSLLSQTQVERFMAVQTVMREGLKDKLDLLESKYKEIETKQDNLNIMQTIQGYGDMLNLIIEAKKAQVAALNLQGFSLGEYAWVKQQVIASSGIPFTGIDWSNPSAEPKLIEAQNVAQENIDLLAPYKENLEQYLSLSFFGL